MSAPTVADAARALADPAIYTDEPRLHTTLATLRADAPVARVEAPGYRPFYAITRHADIMAIERANDLFINGPRPVLMTAAQEDLQALQRGAHADPHGRPAAPRRCGRSPQTGSGPRRCEISRRGRRTRQDLRRQMAAAEWPSCDFVQEIAVNYPLYRHHVAAGCAGVGLPADAEAHPGVIRQRRHRIPARRLQSRSAGTPFWTCSPTSTR